MYFNYNRRTQFTFFKCYDNELPRHITNSDQVYIAFLVVKIQESAEEQQRTLVETINNS